MTKNAHKTDDAFAFSTFEQRRRKCATASLPPVVGSLRIGDRCQFSAVDEKFLPLQ